MSDFAPDFNFICLDYRGSGEANGIEPMSVHTRSNGAIVACWPEQAIDQSAVGLHLLCISPIEELPRDKFDGGMA